MKENPNVLNSDDNARNCTKHTIDIVASPPVKLESNGNPDENSSSTNK